jgi:hypothetical protein
LSQLVTMSRYSCILTCRKMENKTFDHFMLIIYVYLFSMCHRYRLCYQYRARPTSTFSAVCPCRLYTVGCSVTAFYYLNTSPSRLWVRIRTGILSCEKAILLTYRRLVVLLRSQLVAEILHEGAPEALLHQYSLKVIL